MEVSYRALGGYHAMEKSCRLKSTPQAAGIYPPQQLAKRCTLLSRQRSRNQAGETATHRDRKPALDIVHFSDETTMLMLLPPTHPPLPPGVLSRPSPLPPNFVVINTAGAGLEVTSSAEESVIDIAGGAGVIWLAADR